MHVDGADDVAVDLADQDHPDEVDRVGIGHPEAVLELDLLADPFHQRTDLGATTVDHHGQHAHRPHQDDVLGERGQGRVLVDLGLPGLGLQHVPAILDHHHLVEEAPDVRQRLDQDGRLVDGPAVGSGTSGDRTHDVVRFSSM